MLHRFVYPIKIQKGILFNDRRDNQYVSTQPFTAFYIDTDQMLEAQLNTSIIVVIKKMLNNANLPMVDFLGSVTDVPILVRANRPFRSRLVKQGENIKITPLIVNRIGYRRFICNNHYILINYSIANGMHTMTIKVSKDVPSGEIPCINVIDVPIISSEYEYVSHVTLPANTRIGNYFIEESTPILWIAGPKAIQPFISSLMKSYDSVYHDPVYGGIITSLMKLPSDLSHNIPSIDVPASRTLNISDMTIEVSNGYTKISKPIYTIISNDTTILSIQPMQFFLRKMDMIINKELRMGGSKKEQYDPIIDIHNDAYILDKDRQLVSYSDIELCLSNICSSHSWNKILYQLQLQYDIIIENNDTYDCQFLKPIRNKIYMDYIRENKSLITIDNSRSVYLNNDLYKTAIVNPIIAIDLNTQYGHEHVKAIIMKDILFYYPIWSFSNSRLYIYSPMLFSNILKAYRDMRIICKV